MEKKHFDFWDTAADLATDFDVPYPTAHSWVQRGFIPADRDMVRLGLIVQHSEDGLSSDAQFDLLQGFGKERDSAAALRRAAPKSNQQGLFGERDAAGTAA